MGWVTMRPGTVHRQVVVPVPHERSDIANGWSASRFYCHECLLARSCSRYGVLQRCDSTRSFWAGRSNAMSRRFSCRSLRECARTV